MTIAEDIDYGTPPSRSDRSVAVTVDGIAVPEKMPFIVIIVDELATLRRFDPGARPGGRPRRVVWSEKLPGFDMVGWFAVVAPTGTPAAAIARNPCGWSVIFWPTLPPSKPAPGASAAPSRMPVPSSTVPVTGSVGRYRRDLNDVPLGSSFW